MIMVSERDGVLFIGERVCFDPNDTFEAITDLIELEPGAPAAGQIVCGRADWYVDTVGEYCQRCGDVNHTDEGVCLTCPDFEKSDDFSRTGGPMDTPPCSFSPPAAETEQSCTGGDSP